MRVFLEVISWLHGGRTTNLFTQERATTYIHIIAATMKIFSQKFAVHEKYHHLMGEICKCVHFYQECMIITHREKGVMIMHSCLTYVGIIVLNNKCQWRCNMSVREYDDTFIQFFYRLIYSAINLSILSCIHCRYAMPCSPLFPVVEN